MTERRVDRAAHAGHRLGHVGDLVAPDKGGAQIERVRAFLDLLAPHLDAAVPVALLLQSAELARAVGVAALADRQVGVLLAQVHLAVERGDGGGPHRVAPPRQRTRPIPADAPQHRVERGDVRRLGAAAAADQADPVFQHEALEPLRELGGAQRVTRAAVDELRQPGIGLHRDVPGPVLAEPFDVLGHLARAGRAIEPDDRHVERVDDRRRGGDIGADQQGAGGFDRHADQDRNVLAGLVAGALGAVDRGLDLQRILAGLDRDRVAAAGNQPGALQREPVLELLVGDMAERGQPGARPERAEHEAGAAVMGEFGDRLARQFGGAPVQLERAVGDAELAEGDRRAAKAVGLQRVATRFEIAAVDLADQVGRLSHRISVQFSSPRKSRSMSRLRACTCVPIAPSHSTTRSAR